MQLTDELRSAIKAACAAAGGAGAFAKLSGFTQAQISRYTTGVIQSIKDDSWSRLEPLVLPHLKAQHISGIINKTNSEFISAQLAAGCELKLDLTDRPTYLLLEYWRDMADAQRFALLQHADNLFKEQKCKCRE